MSFKWVVLIVSIWIVLSLLGGIMEGAYVGGSEQSTLNTLMSSRVMTSTSIWGKIAGVFTDGAFWDALFTMMMFRFAMFTGEWVILQWIFFLPLLVAFVVTTLLAIFGRVSG